MPGLEFTFPAPAGPIIIAPNLLMAASGNGGVLLCGWQRCFALGVLDTPRSEMGWKFQDEKSPQSLRMPDKFQGAMSRIQYLSLVRTRWTSGQGLDARGVKNLKTWDMARNNNVMMAEHEV